VVSGYISKEPVAPTTVAASDGRYFHKIRVTWTKAVGATSYLVFRTDALSPIPDTAADTPICETSALYYDELGDDLVPGNDDGTSRKYYYWIAAKSPDTCTTVSRPNLGYLSKKGPSRIYASTTYSDRIVVNWTAVPGATGYDVYRYTDSKTIQNEVKVGSNISALEYADTSPSESNYYRVKAKYGEYYDSDFSASSALGKLTAGKSGILENVSTYLENGGSATRSGEKGSLLYFSAEVPMGATRLVATLTGTSIAAGNDANIFAKFANIPTISSYNAKGVENSENETLTVSNPSPGTWYFLLYGFTDYENVTLTVNCYSVTDIILTQVPQNDQSVPCTATFMGMVVDESGIKGVPNLILQVRNPITGLTSFLTKTDAKGCFKYSTPVNAEGEYTFDFLFTDFPETVKGTASHTLWTRKGCVEENNFFDSSAYLPASPVALAQEDIFGIQQFLNIRNGWEYGAIDSAYETIWLEKTIAAAPTDSSLLGKLDSGLYMLLYGVEGAGAGNEMTATAAFSAVPFVVHVKESQKSAVLLNLNTLGLIDEAQKDDIIAGNIGVVAMAALNSVSEEIDGNRNISLSGRGQLELLANLAGNISVTCDAANDKTYGLVNTKLLNIETGAGTFGMRATVFTVEP
jgi:hypothetical protein